MAYQANSLKAIRGRESEIRFAKIMQRHQWEVKDASIYENKMEHIDYFAQKDEEKMIIDVKGSKHCAGHNGTWIEVQNEFGEAWLYADRVTHFAFENEGGFNIITKEDLQEIVHTHYKDAKELTANFKRLISDTKRYCYRREGRKREKTILIDTNYIKQKSRFFYAQPNLFDFFK